MIAAESVLEKLVTLMTEKAGGYLDYVLYALLGLQVVLFVVGVVCTFLNGELNSVTKLAKQYLRGQIAGETAVMKAMPVKLKKLYKRARKSGAKPSDTMTAEACVLTPYALSFASKFTAYTAISTVLVALVGLGVGGMIEGGLGGSTLVIVACTAALGAILTAVAALLARTVRVGAYKTYLAFIDKLDGDDMSVPETPMSAESYQPNAAQEAYAQADAYRDEPITQEYAQAEPVTQDYVQPEAYPQTDMQPEQPVYAQAEVGNTFAPSESITYEPDLETETPVAAPVEQPAEDPAAAKARARAEAIARMQAEQAQIRREQQTQAAAQAQAQAEAARAAVEAKANTVSTEDVIARIEQISNEGAPLATMKEVALLLQKERAKPENKTPESQRKLNEALSKLLKAMSAARK